MGIYSIKARGFSRFHLKTMEKGRKCALSREYFSAGSIALPLKVRCVIASFSQIKALSNGKFFISQGRQSQINVNLMKQKWFLERDVATVNGTYMLISYVRRQHLQVVADLQLVPTIWSKVDSVVNGTVRLHSIFYIAFIFSS